MRTNLTRALFALVALSLLLGSLGIAFLLSLVGTKTARASGVTITEFPLPTDANGGRGPWGITTGPDGNLWFTEREANAIGKITPTGTVTEFPLPTSNSFPTGITTGPDGNLWFTETFGNAIGRITPAGSITELPLPTSNSEPWGITSGPAGNLWFTETGTDNIGTITPDGSITEFPVPTSGSQLLNISTGPDGNLWFPEMAANNIDRMTPAGSITQFPVPTSQSNPLSITSGPAGNLWFTEYDKYNIGTITPAGSITEFPLPTSSSTPWGITPGPDGNLWFTDQSGNAIGTITPAGSITEFPLPTSQSLPVYITSGPDGNVWFTEEVGNAIGRVNLPSSTSGSGGSCLLLNPLPNATRNQGDTYATNGSFTDPCASSWTATVNYGDGSGVQPLPLTSMTFALSHVYATVGTYTLTVQVTDTLGNKGTATATVTVIPTTTVTFDDISPVTPLNGSYAGINWGTSVWDVDGPIATDSTNSISFHTSTVTGGTFSFASPQVLLSTQLESNSAMTAMISLSCAGNPTVSAQVAPGATATLTTYWQTPCTTVTVTSSNSWNTNLDNLVYSSIPNSTLPPTPPPPPANTYGYPVQGALLDTGDANYMNGSKITTGATGGTVQSMSVFVGNVDSGTHNQYQLAIYTDNGGKPGTLLAQSAKGTLTPLSWNTLSISATLQPNTTYWLMYNTNATTSTNYLNNLYFDPGAQGIAAWAKHTFGSWPTTFPSATLDMTQFSMYVTYH